MQSGIGYKCKEDNEIKTNYSKRSRIRIVRILNLAYPDLLCEYQKMKKKMDKSNINIYLNWLRSR